MSVYLCVFLLGTWHSRNLYYIGFYAVRAKIQRIEAGPRFLLLVRTHPVSCHRCFSSSFAVMKRCCRAYAQNAYGRKFARGGQATKRISPSLSPFGRKCCVNGTKRSRRWSLQKIDFDVRAKIWDKFPWFAPRVAALNKGLSVCLQPEQVESIKKCGSPAVSQLQFCATSVRSSLFRGSCLRYIYLFKYLKKSVSFVFKQGAKPTD